MVHWLSAFCIAKHSFVQQLTLTMTLVFLLLGVENATHRLALHACMFTVRSWKLFWLASLSLLTVCIGACWQPSHALLLP
jgi:hypothetical protein